MSAKTAAQAALEVYWNDDGFTPTPIDPIIIARAIGINVYTAPMENSTSGYIIKDNAGEPDIFVNTEHSAVRQRFTIAHELGHYFQQQETNHPEETYSYKRDELASCGADADEVYANQFAAELLAPEPVIRELHDAGCNAMRIAKDLHISLEATRHRLRNLGLYGE